MSKINYTKLGTVSADFGKYQTSDSYENLGLDNPAMDNEWKECFLMPKNYMRSIISRLDGIMMTIIESSTDDKEKREATKSITRRMIWQEASEIRLLKLNSIK